MSPNDQLFVERIVKKSGSSFYWGMKLLPANKRREKFGVDCARHLWKFVGSIQKGKSFCGRARPIQRI